MSTFRLLGRDLLLYGVMGGVSRSVHLLLLPILTRQFSPAEYGVIDIIAVWTSVFTLFIVLSLQSAVARFWTEAERENEYVDLVFGILVFVLFYGALVFLLAWSQSDYIAKWVLDDAEVGSYITLGTAAAFFTALAHIPLMVLRMQRRVAYYTLLTFVQTVLFATLALLLILQFDTGVEGVFVAQVIATATAFVVGMLSTAGCFKGRFTFDRLKSSLSFSVPMVPAVMVSKINSSLDRVLLLGFLGLGVVGIYSASARIAMVMNLLVSVFQQAWTPLAMKVIENESERAEFYRRGLNYYVGAMVVIGLVIGAFAKELVALLVPVEYQSGYVVIPWLVAATILHGTASFTNLGMAIKKKTFGNSKAAWSGAVVNIVLGVTLIPSIGIWGAAIGSLVGSLIFTTLLYRYSKAVVEIHFDVSKLIGIFACYMISGAIFVSVSEYVDDYFWSLILRTALLLVSIIVVAYLAADSHVYRSLRSVLVARK